MDRRLAVVLTALLCLSEAGAAQIPYRVPTALQPGSEPRLTDVTAQASSITSQLVLLDRQDFPRRRLTRREEFISNIILFGCAGALVGIKIHVDANRDDPLPGAVYMHTLTGAMYGSAVGVPIGALFFVWRHREGSGHRH